MGAVSANGWKRIRMWWLFFVLLGGMEMVCAGGIEEARMNRARSVTQGPIVQSESEGPEPTEEQQMKAKAFRLAVIVTIVFVISLFVVILLLAIVRINRFRRKRTHLGEKGEPTEYVDAWSQYRLKEDTDQSEPRES